MIGVYKIVNIIDGKCYIGSSINIERRFSQHIKELENNSHNNKHLQFAWNKYGKDNFKFEIVEETTENDLRYKERYYIQKLDVTNHNIGYNMLSDTDIGTGVHTSIEVRQKISDACKGEKNGHYGKCHTDESRKKISYTKKLKSQQKWIDEKHICENCGKIMLIKYNRAGRFCSEFCIKEHKAKLQSEHTKGIKKPDGFGAKLSKSLKGVKKSQEHCSRISESAKKRLSIPENNPMFGKKHTDETKHKISESLRKININSSRFAGHKHTEESKQKISNTLKERTKIKNDQK